MVKNRNIGEVKLDVSLKTSFIFERIVKFINKGITFMDV